MTTKKAKIGIFFGAILLLIMYAFRKVNQGIDVTDTGYHFSNFMYMSEMDPMWIFSTYLSSLMGYFFTRLPGGDTLLGINIYTSIIPAMLAVVTFVFLVKVLQMRIWESFAGVLIALALCWCPTTCVYNYLTYLLFNAGAILLYMGLIKDKPWILFGAGVCLGLNVLVRFPNVAEAAMIVAVWYACFLQKKTFAEYIKKTGWCLGGYLAGMGIVFAQIVIQYGVKEYVNGIIRLLGMTGDASDYTLYSMIYNLIQAYLFSGKWVLIIVICVMLGVLGFMVLPNKLFAMKCIGYGVCCAILVRWFYGQGMFSLAYDSYGSIQNWGAGTVIVVLLFAICYLVSPVVSDREKIWAAIVIVVIGITPLGSNNQLYANINNMFLIVPFAINVLTKLMIGTKKHVLKLKSKTLIIYKWPLILMLASCLIMLLVQSVMFGHVFIFRDGVPRESTIESIASLEGMKTNADNKESLETLGEYVSDAELEGRQVLLFGDVPGLSAYLKMPFVMSPWPDLPSYSRETFAAELERVVANMDASRPVVILGEEFHAFMTDQMSDVVKLEAYETKYGYKLSVLKEMLDSCNYNCTFNNGVYVVYE